VNSLDLGDRVKTVVVGAGQAGLAMGHALIAKGLTPQEDFVLLDRAEPEELEWRRRWHSLRLFTPAWYSTMPGLPVVGRGDKHLRTDEVADYLDAYRDMLGLRPLWGTIATRVEPDAHGHGLRLATSKGTIWARSIVAATGPFSTPRWPQIANRLVVPGVQLHSDAYLYPRQIPGGSVLVVGAGNTGIQIARELSTSHEVHIATGSPQRTLPAKVFGVSIFRWLAITSLLRASPRGPLGPLLRGETVVGEGVEALQRDGVVVHGRAVDARDDEVLFSDGTTLCPQSVIWATGYRPGLDWLSHLVPEDSVRGSRGKTSVTGLYLLGAPWLSSRGSALIGGVGRDARRLARWIADAP
jgi:putative flavoprotein involved in K+ transport